MAKTLKFPRKCFLTSTLKKTSVGFPPAPIFFFNEKAVACKKFVGFVFIFCAVEIVAPRVSKILQRLEFLYVTKDYDDK